MPLIVRKYGGSSVESIEKIIRIAEQIKELVEAGNQVVVVVSAMGKTTNDLLKSAQEITSNPDKRELDMLLSIGERKSISLVSLALNAIGVPSQSFTGSQVGIITDNQHGNARILEVKADRIEIALKLGKVVVVAGYQGVSTEKEITTLGRGGTDTTAVAIAARLNADRCELMKDIDGLYSVPPNILKNAHLRSEVSFIEMKEIAAAGSELIAETAIDIAMNSNVKLSIGSTTTNKIGSQIITVANRKMGISQLVLKKCSYVNSNEEDKNPYIKTFQTDSSILSINLDPDKSNPNGLFLTVLGKQLAHFKSELNHIYEHSVYFMTSNEKIEILYPISYEETILSKIRTVPINH